MNSFKLDLNLLISYPVKWNKYKVLRDFIQNFYDSVPRNEFNKRFSWIHKNNTLTLSCQNVSFNYQWLVHIGGSTKRDDKCTKSAGYFGEGFKIASLCSIRDYDWNISTFSSDWSLDVIATEIYIDNKKVSSLAYKVFVDLPLKNDTILEISNFDENDIEIFKCALNSFFFKENLLVGKKIFENEVCSIYHRSKTKKPNNYPVTYDLNGDGIVFAAFQALGSIDIPLVISYNNYINDDRDRNFFSKIDIINILVKCIWEIDSETTFIILQLMEKYWYTYPNEKYGYNSYYTVIKNLIYKLNRNSKLSDKFKSLYPNLLTAEKNEVGDIYKRNKRTFALAWLKNNPYYKLVQDNFSLLGYKSLEDICHENNALPIVREVTQNEQRYIDVLETAAKKILGDFLAIESFPLYKIIENRNSSAKGYAETIKLNKPIKTPYGFKYRNKVNTICLKHDIFEKESFDVALSTFIHELCHCFGGDKSESFSYALTKAMDMLINNCEIIIESNNLWNNL